MCQEYILQWSQQYHTILQYHPHVTLTMISIGVPEKAQALIQHLELERRYGTHTMLYVDDIQNTIYDALQLNRGIQRTFFHRATPLSFLQRFQTSMNSLSSSSSLPTSSSNNPNRDLIHVLSKWKDAVYIPPKSSQALLQGGTFVLRDQQTLYAHYDPSTAAHAPISTVLDIAVSSSSSSSL